MAPERVDIELDAGIDPEQAEHELAVLSAHLDAAMHRQLVLIHAIDVTYHWHRQGATSCAHWLSWRIGMDLGAARERLRVAHALRSLPAIDDALRRGELSYSKVRAMTRVATPENEAKLLDMARHSTASQLERICRGVRAQRAADATAEADAELERWVRLRHRGEPTVRLEAELLPDEAERVMEALCRVRAQMAVEHGAAARPSLADALVRAADELLSAGAMADHEEPARDEAPTITLPRAATRTYGGDRADVLVHFGPDALGEGLAATMDDGGYVSAETLRRLACDCGLVGVTRDTRGDVLDVGRKTRRIPPALRRAVMARDARCTFPGCTHDRFIDLHHVEHWLHGGATSLDNLCALCTFHHTLVHEEGWRIELYEGTPLFYRPDGARIDTSVAPPAAPEDPLAAFEALHDDLAIHDETGLTRWDGSTPDYHACVHLLCVAEEGVAEERPREHGLEEHELARPAIAWLREHGYA